MAVTAWAPGRVSIIGDHTDYTGGLALPMPIQLGTTVTFAPGGRRVELRSDAEPHPAVVAVDGANPSLAEPGWARLVAGVVAAVRPVIGGTGTVRSDLPIGAGLSSSAALEVAVALAIGCSDIGVRLARTCQRAEHIATGVPTGVLDQATATLGTPGAAILLDCDTLAYWPILIPSELDVVVVPSGERRALAATAYAERVDQCAAAERIVGPLRRATPATVDAIVDPVLRRRARHVVSENRRVAALALAFETRDLRTVGALLAESHASLRDDYEVSTPGIDAIVERVTAIPGVLGARITGGGFGGCVVALVAAGTDIPGGIAVHSTGAARVEPGSSQRTRRKKARTSST